MEQNQLFNASYYSELKADLKAAMAEFKVTLENVIHDVEEISDTISTLNKDSTIYKAKMDYVCNDVEQLKAHQESIKAINDSILLLKDAFNKFEIAFNKHTEVATNSFNSINYDINSIKTELDKLPLLYVSKTNHSIGDIIKLAPGIITILSVLLAALVIYLKGVL